MIKIDKNILDFNNPFIFVIIIGFILFTILILMVLRASARSAKATEPLSFQMGQLGEHIQKLSENQHQLSGGLKHISEAQAIAQSQMLQTLERRLEEVQYNMRDSLHGTATKTAHSLGELQARLEAIDKAQSNIEKLSGNVLSLQDILSNKQTRGAFGEIQLNDIVTKALAPDAYKFQPTLSNGKRPDCIIHLPNPPGSIAIDSKFPLEAYEAIRNANSDAEMISANKFMKSSLRKHIKDISQKYIIEGETADGALMFLPSEAVYAELHANFPEIVREGFDARVWIVSPTTCMATLNTMRAILKDARMREQTGAIRRELAALFKDVERLSTRVESLDRHFSQASKDVEEIKISAHKVGTRARRIDAFDFEEITTEPTDITSIESTKI